MASNLDLPWWALITTDELERDALESLTDPAVPLGDIGVQVIRDATKLIESYLDRTIIVRKVAQGVDKSGWIPYVGSTDADVAVYAREWPVVETITSNIDPGRNSRRLVRGSEKTDEFEYFAGYKRQDQTQSGLSSDVSELSNLTEAPPDLPDQYRRVCLELCLEALQSAEDATLGSGRRQQQIGDGNMITVDAVDTGFVNRTLGKLDGEGVLV